LTDDSVLLPNPGLILEPDFNRFRIGNTFEMRAQRAREVFLERFDDLAVLRGMSGTRAYVGKAEFLQKRADVSLAIVNAETLLDDTLEIDPPLVSSGSA